MNISLCGDENWRQTLKWGQTDFQHLFGQQVLMDSYLHGNDALIGCEHVAESSQQK